MMAIFEHRTRLPFPAATAFAWHDRPRAFERLAPPWRTMRMVATHGTIRDGDWTRFRLKAGPLWLEWHAMLHGFVQDRQFTDVQVKGPFARWRHTHRFTPDGPDGFFMEEHIEYEPPGGAVGRLLGARLAEPELRRLFAFRHRRLHEDLRRHALWAGRPPWRIAISGASGLVGSQLAAFLATGGHDVFPLVRRAPRTPREIRWNPEQAEIDAAAFEGIDAVVHLAGESVAAGRWTPSQRARIRTSRIDGTRTLAQALSRLRRPPRVLVCASAVGFYGSRGDEILTEESAPGAGFLPETALAWEAASGPACRAGIRIVHLRIGVVLTPQGGMLGRLLPIFRLGLGGRTGTGRQWISWVALDDLLAMIQYALFDESMRGPYNATSPHPVTNADFARTLARVLRRPALLPVPSAAIRAAFGEMGRELILEGNRVLPARLQSTGFEHFHADLEGALRFVLGRPRT
ncbi:MAG: TIGR01777 family protein [Candidatus Sumerlaeia bacterium]|nr:TIGR01777 family protein [Candidatus Sumerlaeia bacterium]